MSTNGMLLTDRDEHLAPLTASLDDATMLMMGIGCGRLPQLAGHLRRVRADIAVLLVHAGRMPCRVASEQTAEAVLLELLLAVALARGGPEEMADLVHLAGDLAPRLLAAEAFA